MTFNYALQAFPKLNSHYKNNKPPFQTSISFEHKNDTFKDFAALNGLKKIEPETVKAVNNASTSNKRAILIASLASLLLPLTALCIVRANDTPNNIPISQPNQPLTTTVINKIPINTQPVISFINPIRQGGVLNEVPGIKNTQARDFHEGIDILAPVGTPLVSPFNGIIAGTIKGMSAGNNSTGVFEGEIPPSDWNRDCGNAVLIKAGLPNGQNIYALMCHMNDVGVSVGQQVQQGVSVGTVGNTGRSDEPHLHLEVSNQQASIRDYSCTPDGINICASRILYDPVELFISGKVVPLDIGKYSSRQATDVSQYIPYIMAMGN